eukprot:4415858-Alexandrium_andersonii.AAC.1
MDSHPEVARSRQVSDRASRPRAKGRSRAPVARVPGQSGKDARTHVQQVLPFLQRAPLEAL